ncbi:MAG: copper homeostasis protein CutC [Bacteroidota bacterium]
MKGTLEICCTSYESASIADSAGADRIELCDNIFEGGTTPGPGLISRVCDNLNIDCYVLIRPRGGDFVYSDDEFEIMKADIRYCKEQGAEGIVSGVLTETGEVDVERTKQLVALVGDMDFTFHRAFDLTVDPQKALHDVIKTGASRILTSGLQNNVVEGKVMLRDLANWAGSDIKIMAGGGLKSSNFREVMDFTGCKEFHTTAKTWKFNQPKKGNDVPMNGAKDIPEDKVMVVSAEEINKIKEILEKS